VNLSPQNWFWQVGPPPLIRSVNSAFLQMAELSFLVAKSDAAIKNVLITCFIIDRDLPIAVVEAKNITFPAETGVQQAREYAETLGLKFAYATNGHRIIEIDYTTGTEQYIDYYPSPADLWRRLASSSAIPEAVSNHLLEPFNLVSGKIPRYYQVIAINRVMEAILLGHKRILATLATGTGKTCVAFQLCWKLWNSRWNRTGEYRRPKILFLADRNILVDDPMAKMFAPFGDARYKISSNDVSQGREMYFGIYQALTNPSSDVFRQYRPDFFDLIIIDECHRGSSRNDSNWAGSSRLFQTGCSIRYDSYTAP
jgi:type I restriction enzyme, R subunit